MSPRDRDELTTQALAWATALRHIPGLARVTPEVRTDGHGHLLLDSNGRVVFRIAQEPVQDIHVAPGEEALYLVEDPDTPLVKGWVCQEGVITGSLPPLDAN